MATVDEGTAPVDVLGSYYELKGYVGVSGIGLHAKPHSLLSSFPYEPLPPLSAFDVLVPPSALLLLGALCGETLLLHINTSNSLPIQAQAKSITGTPVLGEHSEHKAIPPTTAATVLCARAIPEERILPTHAVFHPWVKLLCPEYINGSSIKLTKLCSLSGHCGPLTTLTSPTNSNDPTTPDLAVVASAASICVRFMAYRLPRFVGVLL